MSIFTKIIARELPAKIHYEDDLCMCIADIDPKAPVHAILFPKKVIPTMSDLADDDAKLIGHCFLKATEVAKKLKIDQTGYRLVVNTNADAGQSVPHIHIHILGGRSLGWPPG